MTQEAREARNAYKREWARKHPDKIRRYQETFWNKKAQETAAAAEADTGTETEEGANQN